MRLPRLREEQGFTLIEILVVILIIGILAAIAIPRLLGQSESAQDADAKSMVRNLQTQVESCMIGTRGFDRCNEDDELPKNGLRWGTGPGEVQVLADPIAGYDVAYIATSKTGTYFAIARTSDKKTERYCLVPANRYPTGACKSGGGMPGFGQW